MGEKSTVKTYRAKSMYEALALIRAELGPDAMLVDTREVYAPRWFGLARGRRLLEVTARLETTLASGLETLGDMALEIPHDFFTTEPDPEPAPEPLETSPMLFPLNDFFSRIPNVCEGADVARATTPARHGPFTESDISPRTRDALLQIFVELCGQDMDESAARAWVRTLRQDLLLYASVDRSVLDSDVDALRGRLSDAICREMRTTGGLRVTPGRRRTVALVGPTGVGKTTTIAKLAAYFRQKMRLNVGLITLDLFRMGAMEQLQTFADVIGIPMFVATSPKTMRDAMGRLEDFDLVLIDTAGRSPNDQIPLQETRVLLDEAAVDEVHLVLASTSRLRVLRQTAEKFASLNTNSLIITKLDESIGLGNLCPLIQGCRLPVSYVTTGQTVPDDFEAAQSERLTRWILGSEPVAASVVSLGGTSRRRQSQTQLSPSPQI